MKHRIFTSSNLLVLVGVTALYIYLLVSISNSLKTKSYVINRSHLYKLDSIKMLRGAYTVGGGKSGTTYIFEDETYKTFEISGAADKSLELKQKLKSVEVIMTIYTDKEGYENYFSKNKSWIDVYELEMGNKKYINIENININNEKFKYQHLFIFSSLYLIFLIIHFFRVTRTVPFK